MCAPSEVILKNAIILTLNVSNLSFSCPKCPFFTRVVHVTLFYIPQESQSPKVISAKLGNTFIIFHRNYACVLFIIFLSGIYTMIKCSICVQIFALERLISLVINSEISRKKSKFFIQYMGNIWSDVEKSQKKPFSGPFL